ncbi:MAG: nitrous oxide-stimulated promoter family protein [Thiovulaceae bacterium]|nr:nitrous oxide-stimulated promoter family protein [Sulfurimonadaceae bacterium]
MQLQKLQEESAHLERFFSLYCSQNHTCQEKRSFRIMHEEIPYLFEASLCEECAELLGYALERLSACPHDPKPRCRTCQEPCYDKKEWKALAKVMRYAALRVELGKLRDFVLRPFTPKKRQN